MGFLDNLKLRGVFDPQQASGGGMQGMPTNPIAQTLNTIKPFMLDMNNRALQDQRSLQNIRGEGIANNRMQQTFNPMQPTKPMDVVFNEGPKPNNAYTDAMAGGPEKREIAAQALKAKTANDSADNRRADQKLALDKEGLQLDKLKNSQIYDTKIKDMERKTNEAENKLALAERNATGKEANLTVQNTLKQAQLDATNARHLLDIAQKEAALEEQKRVGSARIKDLEDQIANRSKTSTTTTTVNEDGTEKVASTVKSDPKAVPEGKIKVIGPNGQTGTVSTGTKLPTGWKKAG